MDLRANSRILVNKQIACWVDGDKDFAVLYDLSTDGCMIEMPNNRLKTGQSIRLELGDYMTLNGTVVWKTPSNSGIIFESIIHESVVESFGFHPSGVSFGRSNARDRFGYPI